MGKLWPEDTYMDDDLRDDDYYVDTPYPCEAHDDYFYLDITPEEFRREWERYIDDDHDEFGPFLKGIRLA